MIKARQTNDHREVLERQALICKAFANSTRLHMLRLLWPTRLAAGELQEELAIYLQAKSVAAHHGLESSRLDPQTTTRQAGELVPRYARG